MILVNPSIELIDQEPGLIGIYRQIEKAGRNCYKSEDKITETSAKPFVDMLIKKGHGAMLEHGAVYLKTYRIFEYENNIDLVEETNSLDKYSYNSYSKVIRTTNDIYVTTNYRVLVENNWLDDLKYLCKPTEYHERRITVKITADIHFYKDATRHRLLSYGIESTRYCDYLKEKFGLSVSFMKPSWLEDKDTKEFEKDCRTIEQIYFKWRDRGWRPEQSVR